MAAEVLRDRDLNTQLEQATPDPAAKPAVKPADAEREAPRREFDDRLKENHSAAGNSKQTYISPSDAIMSPASKKLSSFKQKQMDRHPAPKQRSLFQKALKSRDKDLGPE